MSDWILIKLQRNTERATWMRPCIRNGCCENKSNQWLVCQLAYGLLCFCHKIFQSTTLMFCLFIWDLKCVWWLLLYGFFRKISVAQFCRSSYHCKPFSSLYISLMTKLCFIHIVDVDSLFLYYVHKHHQLYQHFCCSDYLSFIFARRNAVQPLAIVKFDRVTQIHWSSLIVSWH